MIMKNIICNHRRLLFTFIFAGVLLIFMACGISQKASASTRNVKQFKCISIERDDTLWSIAEEYMTEEYEDIDTYIKEVKDINGLTDDTLYNGATILIPYYTAPM